MFSLQFAGVPTAFVSISSSVKSQYIIRTYKSATQGTLHKELKAGLKKKLTNDLHNPLPEYITIKKQVNSYLLLVIYNLIIT